MLNLLFRMLLSVFPLSLRIFAVECPKRSFQAVDLVYRGPLIVGIAIAAVVEFSVAIADFRAYNSERRLLPERFLKDTRIAGSVCSLPG
ncbi:hypothetical protein PI124_g1322 [Phytophthora idaei]|nr:hypothetical protein PI125_g14102 [Phytophthora idaei]KAG3155750.1 hypothetical protein PI126_g9032 [Phytophthora idaei]KAG3254066.1 hypothetical protein PI124_g1322 [Phytophthora idaei]